jgi:hypothetical protein
MFGVDQFAEDFTSNLIIIGKTLLLGIGNDKALIDELLPGGVFPQKFQSREEECSNHATSTKSQEPSPWCSF